MLTIKNLYAHIEGKEILKGLSLEVKPGEIHAIMGPNGSGKTTLSQILAGRENYQITSGSIEFMGKDLLAMSVEERAWAGIFLAFQYPVGIPGIKNTLFLRTALNAVRTHKGLPELDALEFLKLLKEKAALVEMKKELLDRSLNDGFSGGEKKRNEILQMILLEPTLAVLDETDSGLDIDALRIVAKGVNALRSPHRSMLVITHYQRLLDYIVPDVIHILANGKIIKSGPKELALELETKGYGWVIEQAAQSSSVSLPGS